MSMNGNNSNGPVGQATPRPWWRVGMMWLVIGGPSAVVLASFVTLALALAHPDPVIEAKRVDPSADLRQTQAEQPAMKARNHAATGGL
ncbi:hypothetical protein [Roseateles sp. DAIF2]|uniref:hypothetical protein n=1 Tax=Roseateles sp. DAIF2 TaxID=2714952 RepID=UPI00201D3793|nr:hypothetical protein [Roseateles sp. DAIF2]